MYAIIQSGGRQVRVKPGEIVTVDRIDAPSGTDITSHQVLLVGGDAGEVASGTPFLAGASVVATVLGEAAGPKIRIFKKKRRKGYRRTKGHRTVYTRLQVKEILT